MSRRAYKGPDGASVGKFPAPQFEFPASGEEPHHSISLCVASRPRPGARAIFWARAPPDALGVKQEFEKALAPGGKPTT
jgi:hypothetical protein